MELIKEVQIKAEVEDVQMAVKKEATPSPVKSERQSVSPVKKPIKMEEESEDDDKPLVSCLFIMLSL